MDSSGRCSTALASFLGFQRLLDGRGVARLYDDGIMLVNWDYMPEVVPVLDRMHPDFDRAAYPDGTPVLERDTARRVFGDNAHWFSVPEGLEGRAKTVELVERMAYERAFRWDYLVLDLSASHPGADVVAFIRALMEMCAVKGKGIAPWEQALRVDHALAGCSDRHGAGSAASVALKSYDESDIFDFIGLHRQAGLPKASPWVAVGGDFWMKALQQPGGYEREVLTGVLEASSEPHGPHVVTLETPGRKHRAREKHAGTAVLSSSDHGTEYEVDERTRNGLLANTLREARRLRYEALLDPEGEMVLFVELSPPGGERGDEADVCRGHVNLTKPRAECLPGHNRHEHGILDFPGAALPRIQRPP
jgi:ribonucleoside-triphosphate reductase (formate)